MLVGKSSIRRFVSAHMVTAKNIIFDQPGAGVEGYDITPQNIGARYAKLWANRTNVKGGSKQIFDAIRGNTDKSLARSPNSAVAQQFKQYLGDGQWPDKPSVGFLKFAGESIDYGLRETGRAAQHKHGFLDSFMGQLLMVAGEVAVGAVAGPWAGAALGATAGYVKDHSVLGTIAGGLGGYGAGSLGAGIANGGVGNAWKALTNPANGAGITATGGGTGVANALTNVGTSIAGSGVSAAGKLLGLVDGGSGGKLAASAAALVAGGSLVSNRKTAAQPVVDPGLSPADPANQAAQTPIGAAGSKEARRLGGTRGGGLASTFTHGAAGVPNQPVSVRTLIPKQMRLVGNAYSANVAAPT